MNSVNINQDSINAFHQRIFSWWKENKREFPWRKTTDPYKIMVSEIMLQQTQASHVASKYNNFIKRFPTLEKLAHASKAEILSLWSGLGYNRRALWLQEAARTIVEKGVFPQTPKELEKLKGIGPYTAKSILIFAFNLDIATVDTNIRRILIAENFATEETSEKQLFEIANKLLPIGKSSDWHNALMDFGATFLTARKTGISPTSKQSNFKDSDREKRGQILKYLLEEEKATFPELKNHLKIEKKRLETILEKMVKDGLLNKIDERYSI